MTQLVGTPIVYFFPRSYEALNNVMCKYKASLLTMQDIRDSFFFAVV